jgi:hypothetical protein
MFEKVKIVKFLHENKEVILDNLSKEQNFRIPLNSIDTKVFVMQNLFSEVGTQMDVQIRDLKNEIETSMNQIDKLQTNQDKIM